MAVPRLFHAPPPGRWISSLLCLVVLAQAPGEEPVALPTTTSLTVAALMGSARASHPSLAAVEAARLVAAARYDQAGIWANPELEVRLGKTRPRQDGIERDRPVAISLRQRLTWWGTRQARRDVAQAQGGIADAEARVAGLLLGSEVRRAAITYDIAQQAATQASEETRLAADLLRLSQVKADAGTLDRASLARLRLEVTTATLGEQTRQREVKTALALLRLWCTPDLPEGLVIRDALPSWPAPSSPAVATELNQHPRLQALTAAIEAAAATVTAERQGRIPDVTLGVFTDREADRDTYGLTVGIDVPLWDRGGSAIAGAEAAQTQAEALRRLERRRLQRDLSEALGNLQSAQDEAQALAGQAMPAAEEMIRLKTAAYQAGEADLTDLLEARRAIHQVRADLRAARQRAALAQIDWGLALGDPALAAGSRP